MRLCACGSPTRKRWDDPEKFRTKCRRCEKRSYTYTSHKGDVCEACGFIPEDLCQLDVDHIDNDHSNNDPSNLQTLCANCHRLKTKKSPH